MMNKEQEIKNIKDMIVNLNKAINNAQQFGDEATVNAINNQIAMYRNRLAELEAEEVAVQEQQVEEQEVQEVQEVEAVEVQEVQYIKGMIVELNKAINNAQQFGDNVTVNAINNQISMYQRRLAQLNNN